MVASYWSNFIVCGFINNTHRGVGVNYFLLFFHGEKHVNGVKTSQNAFNFFFCTPLLRFMRKFWRALTTSENNLCQQSFTIVNHNDILSRCTHGKFQKLLSTFSATRENHHTIYSWIRRKTHVIRLNTDFFSCICQNCFQYTRGRACLSWWDQMSGGLLLWLLYFFIRL